MNREDFQIMFASFLSGFLIVTVTWVACGQPEQPRLAPCFGQAMVGSEFAGITSTSTSVSCGDPQ